MSLSDAPGVLELRDVAKSLGPVLALRSASLTVRAREIHALVGENGAGKSTLIKIVAGVHRLDRGDLRLAGADADFSSTAESNAAGVAVIHQVPTLFPDLSVTENVFMGRQPLGAAEVNARWQQEMADFFVDLGDARPDTGFVRLREVFHLEDQLAAHRDQGTFERTQT